MVQSSHRNACLIVLLSNLLLLSLQPSNTVFLSPSWRTTPATCRGYFSAVPTTTATPPAPLHPLLLSLQKFDDGTITVLEFFKLFNIDFVIHSPRQSVLPDRVSPVPPPPRVRGGGDLMSPCYLQLLSDAERTPLDSLRDRHVHHPKHKVYEADVRNLTHKVQRYVFLRAVDHGGDPSGEEGKKEGKKTPVLLFSQVEGADAGSGQASDDG